MQNLTLATFPAKRFVHILCICRIGQSFYVTHFIMTITIKSKKISCFRSAVVSLECTGYITLNATDRNVCYRGKAKCDNNLTTEWYRFQGKAGRQLPTICPPIHRCNTDLPGWMEGKHPNVEDGIVQRQVCFHGYNNRCYKTTTIDVRNCSAYFVYRLTKVPYCNSRYCGTG